MAYFSSSPPQAAHQHPYAHHNVFGIASSSPFGSSSAASLKPPPAAAAGPTAARSRNNSSNNSITSGPRSHHSGELSPGFDQTFQSSMNISFADSGSPTGNSANHHDQHQTYLQHALLAASTASSVAPSSPSAMDVSPAPPSRQHSQQASFNPLPSKNGILAPAFPIQPQRPALAPLVQPSKPAQDAATRSFDHSFFSKLAAHDSGSSRSSSSSSSTSSSSSSSYTSACSSVTATARTRTRSADVPLSSKDANIPSPTLGGNTFVFGAGNTSKEASAATLPLKRPSGLLRASSARPSLFSAHSAIAEYPPRTSSVGAAASPFEGSPRPTAQLERAHSDNALSLGGSFPSRQKDGAGGSVVGRKPSRLANEVDLSCPETTSTSTSTSSLSSASSSLFGSVRPPYPGSHTSGSTTSVSTVTSGQGTSQGRRISGTTRVRSALPKEWQQQQTQSTGEHQPPQLLHAHSTPLIRPAGLSALQQKANSESNLPTRRSLGTEGGSRLAHEILPANSSSSPSGMDVDPSSPQVRSLALQNYAHATGSPGLGDLFAEGGAELALSSPSFQDGQQVVVSRKRAMQDADSSFSSAMSSSPVASATSGTLLGLTDPAFDNAESFGTSGSSSKYATIGASIGKGHPPRLLHRATSALALGAASRRRGSGVQSGNSSFLASLAAVAGPDDHNRDSSQQHLQQQRNSLTLSGTTLLARENSGSTRHRKMSRGADGRPHLLRAGRRSQSMCDSEFYASPPLAANDGTQAKDYFAPQVTIAPVCNSSAAGGDEVEEVLSEDVLSPPRKVPALNAYQPSPEASFSCGFGHKEAQGKILPCFPVKEDGLMRITADTLNDLLSGTYDDHIDQYVIIDCRFDYEYQGGHIEGAINLGTQKAVERFLLRSGGNAYDDCLYQRPEEMPLPSKSGEVDQSGHCKKTILVFHCEFSAKRAPTLAKSLRSKDRALNHAAYPAVHFPELYVLQGGYAECFSKHPERCEPCGYVRMDDPRHLAARANDLGELRRKRIGVRAKSYTFGEGMFAAKQPVPQPKHLSGIAFKPAASSSLATASFTAASNSQSTSGSSSSTGLANNAASKARGSFGSNFFNVIGSSKLCIHEEEHDDDEHGHSSSAEGDNSFSNTKHGQLGNDNSSPCGPMMGSSAAAFTDMSIGNSPCQSSKPSKFGRPGLMSAQTASAAQHLFRPRGLQRASTTTGALF